MGESIIYYPKTATTWHVSRWVHRFRFGQTLHYV